MDVAMVLVTTNCFNIIDEKFYISVGDMGVDIHVNEIPNSPKLQFIIKINPNKSFQSGDDDAALEIQDSSKKGEAMEDEQSSHIEGKESKYLRYNENITVIEEPKEKHDVGVAEIFNICIGSEERPHFKLISTHMVSEETRTAVLDNEKKKRS